MNKLNTSCFNSLLSYLVKNCYEINYYRYSNYIILKPSIHEKIRHCYSRLCRISTQVIRCILMLGLIQRGNMIVIKSQFWTNYKWFLLICALKRFLNWKSWVRFRTWLSVELHERKIDLKFGGQREIRKRRKEFHAWSKREQNILIRK